MATRPIDKSARARAELKRQFSGLFFHLSLALLLLSGIAIPRCVSADETKPRVLILGDGVYQEHARSIAKELAGRVEVIFVAAEPGEVRNSQTAIANLDRWLGEKEWALIHFNFGLSDLVYRAPGIKSFRVFPKEAGGIRATSPQEYEKNLRQLVKRLQATGAKLVWASTTPIRHSPNGIFVKGSEVEYNAIAAKVMADHDIPINDMYTHVSKLLDMDKPGSRDPFYFDRKPLHPPIVGRILKELDLE